MTSVNHRAAAPLRACAAALLMALLAAPSAAGAHLPQYDEQLFGDEYLATFTGGENRTVTWTWTGNVAWNGSQPSIVVPRVPWAIDVNGTAPGPSIEMRIHVNEALTYHNSFATVANSGIVEPRGWPDLSEFGSSGLSLRPFLAKPGNNSVRVEVTVTYDVSGEGNSTVEFGPLFARAVPVADLAHVRDDNTESPLAAQQAERHDAGWPLAGTLALAVAAVALAMGKARRPRR